MITRMPPYNVFDELPKIANQVREISEDLGAELDFAFAAMQTTFDLAVQKASPARTDGWASVEERLPKVNKHVEILISDASVAVNDIPCIGYLVSDGTWWCGIPGHYFHCPQLKWTVTGWRELPAAPGSVPQAGITTAGEMRARIAAATDEEMQPLRDALRIAVDHFGSDDLEQDDGVPQEEPPKEEKA